MRIVFMPDNIEYEAHAGEKLMDAAARAGVLIDGNCGSTGKCGKCRVKVAEGGTSSPDREETAALSAQELRDGYRLACRLRVTDDLVVEVPRINTARTRKTRMMIMPETVELDPGMRRHFLHIAPAVLEEQKADIDRILLQLPGEGISADMEAVRSIPAALHDGDHTITATVSGGEIIAIEAGDCTDANYGVAFDIGTTTVVGMLFDLTNGRLLDVSARTNPQNTFGADVISRIHSIVRDPSNLPVLTNRIRECLNEILQDLAEGGGVDPMDIRDMTVVGNTTMSHLFLGVDPGQMARSPFVPVFTMAPGIRAKDLGINIWPTARVHLLPNIAGHVGSDITAAVLATGIAGSGSCRMLVDVGTNGEIALSCGGRMAACSTAAGPAFEGASIYQGMRASAGAIEGVKLSGGGVELDVIDSERPVGICGSGLIDAVAQLLNAGLIDQKGRLSDRNTAEAAGIPGILCERLRDGEGGREFVLWQGDGDEEYDVVITQKDIREVQLAKGAIYAGATLLLKELGAAAESLDGIIIAGAFGNYIKKESAMRIGMFPPIDEDRIIQAGNAAGTGACLALLSKRQLEGAHGLAKMIEHVELGAHADFQAEFMKAMYFPE